jgi:hypothetical protein
MESQLGPMWISLSGTRPQIVSPSVERLTCLGAMLQGQIATLCMNLLFFKHFICSKKEKRARNRWLVCLHFLLFQQFFNWRISFRSEFLFLLYIYLFIYIFLIKPELLNHSRTRLVSYGCAYIHTYIHIDSDKAGELDIDMEIQTYKFRHRLGLGLEFGLGQHRLRESDTNM